MKILRHILLHVEDFFDILYLILPWYHFTVSFFLLLFQVNGSISSAEIKKDGIKSQKYVLC